MSKPPDLKARQRAFLKAFAISGSVVKAAADAKIQRTQHYRWLQAPAYQKAFDAACNEFADVLEAAVIQRAMEGTLEPVYYKGKVCGAIRRYSDGNAQMLLRGFKPERYRERVEHTGKDGGPIETKSVLPEWLLQTLKAQQVGSTSPSPASGDSIPT